MGWSDILLWIAGISWAYAVVAAVRQSRAGEFTLTRHLVAVAVVGVLFWCLMPAAVGAILVGLWVGTMLIPSLLFRWALRLYALGRHRLVITVCRFIEAMQPLGPLAIAAAQYRHMALLEIGDDAGAAQLVARFAGLPAAFQRSLAWRTLYVRRQWPELLTALGDRQEAEAVIFRIRALGETGDLAGMVAACAELPVLAAANPAQFRQALAVPLAFGGRVAALRELVQEMPAPNRDFWIATARWADGEEAAARDILTAIPARPQSGFARAIAWRLEHPPQRIALAAPEIISAIDRFAALAAPVAKKTTRPWATWAIMAVCVALFALTNCFDDFEHGLWVLGALDTRLDPLENWWRFIAATFLHANFPHIAMNMWALWIFGPGLEQAQGRWRYLTIYLGAGIGAAIVVTVMGAIKHIDTGMVGASGAIMGLIGAQLLIILRYRDPRIPLTRHPQVQRMAWIVMLQTAFDMTHPMVSQSGHIGGFITGFLIAFLVVPRGTSRLVSG